MNIHPATNRGRILLLYGASLPRDLLTRSLAWILLRHHHLYLIDGANAFDAYGLTRLIMKQRQDPRVMLKRIHLSRAFTCYQLAERIASLSSSHPEQPVLSLSKESEAQSKESLRAVYLVGLLDTFYDEDVPLVEATRLLNQMLAQLQQLAGRGALIIITTKLPPVEAAARAVLVQRVKESADVVYHLSKDGGRTTKDE